MVESEWDAEGEGAEGWANRVTSHSHSVLTASLSGLGRVHTGARLASTIPQQVLLHECDEGAVGEGGCELRPHWWNLLPEQKKSSELRFISQWSKGNGCVFPEVFKALSSVLLSQL